MNKLPLNTLILVAVLSVGVSSLMSYILRPQTKVVPQAELALPQVDHSAALTALGEEIASLNRRLAAMELQPVEAQRIPAEAVVDADFIDEVRELMTSTKSPAKVPSAMEMQVKVEDALASIRAEEAAAEQQIKEQRREQWIAGTLEKLSPQLGLSVNQEQDLRGVWLAKNELDTELGRMYGAGEIGRQEAGEMKRSNEEEHQAQLQSVLTPVQYEEYGNFFRGGNRGYRAK